MPSSLPSFSPGTGLSPWALIQNSSINTVNMYDRELYVEGSNEGTESDFTVHKLSDARLDAVHRTQDGIVFGERLISDMYMQPVTGALLTVNQV